MAEHRPLSSVGDMTAPRADLAVIGGSGFYAFLEDTVEVTLDTPYGAPSAPVVIGEVKGRRVAFLPRHGRDHELPAHRINYRANLWALRALGARQVIAPCAVGGLRADLAPGSLVVPDQLVDRTTHRIQTYYDGPATVHVGFADPYCPAGRQLVLDRAESAGWQPRDGGTLVVIEGPRYSTRAESRWYQAQGWSIVGMTGHPEAVLARELALCYTSVALVTDLDAGVEAGEGVSHEEVLEVFGRNMGRLRELLMSVLTELDTERSCGCGQALDGIDTGLDLP